MGVGVGVGVEVDGQCYPLILQMRSRFRRGCERFEILAVNVGCFFVSDESAEA